MNPDSRQIVIIVIACHENTLYIGHYIYSFTCTYISEECLTEEMYKTFIIVSELFWHDCCWSLGGSLVSFLWSDITLSLLTIRAKQKRLLYLITKNLDSPVKVLSLLQFFNSALCVEWLQLVIYKILKLFRKHCLNYFWIIFLVFTYL